MGASKNVIRGELRDQAKRVTGQRTREAGGREERDANATSTGPVQGTASATESVGKRIRLAGGTCSRAPSKHLVCTAH